MHIGYCPIMASSSMALQVDSLYECVANLLGYRSLKSDQKAVITICTMGKDISVVLPICYGENLYYAFIGRQLPFAFCIRNVASTADENHCNRFHVKNNNQYMSL